MTAPSPPIRPPLRWTAHLPPLALLAALTLWAAYPFWPALSTRIEDLGDPLLNAWILSWDHWALFHQLGDFFSANIFWPHADSLAFGEPMLTQALLTLPLLPFFPHPVALHNLSVMQAVFFSGLAAYALGFHYFRRVGPAAVCALVYGPAAYRVNQSVHVQLIHGEFLPLMILAIERLLAGGGRRWRWLLGAAALGQWLSSWYWTVFSFWCVAPYLIVRLWQKWREMRNAECGMRNLKSADEGVRAPSVPHLILPLLLAGALTLPVAWPALRLMRQGTMIRPAEPTAFFAAHPADFITPGRRSLLYAGLDLERRLGGGGAERALFPGFFVAFGFLATLVLGLQKKSAICNLQSAIDNSPEERTGASALPGNPQSDGVADEDVRAPSKFPLRLWLFITIVLLAFTFGSSAAIHFRGAPYTIPLPLALLKWFPAADQMRAPARWMLPALLGLALLAACAWDRLRQGTMRNAECGMRNGKKRNILAVGAFLFLIAETLTRPAVYESVPARQPPVLDWLNRQPRPSPVLFIPPAYPRVMLEAAWLRQPTLNGTNGYFPPLHRGVIKYQVSDFPLADSVANLLGLGIRFVVINTFEAGRPSAGWNPARYPEMMAALPPTLKTLRLGQYLIIDLGRPETDIGRIARHYHQIELLLFPALSR